MNPQFCSICGTKLNELGSCEDCNAGKGRQLQPSLHINAVGFLCYLFPFISSILFLHLSPYREDPRVRFFAWQSIALHAFFLGLYFIFLIGFGLFAWGVSSSDPFALLQYQSLFIVLPFISGGIVSLGGFLVFGLSLAALGGRVIRLPIAGRFATARVEGRQTSKPVG